MDTYIKNLSVTQPDEFFKQLKAADAALGGVANGSLIDADDSLPVYIEKTSQKKHLIHVTAELNHYYRLWFEAKKNAIEHPEIKFPDIEEYFPVNSNQLQKSSIEVTPQKIADIMQALGVQRLKLGALKEIYSEGFFEEKGQKIFLKDLCAENNLVYSKKFPQGVSLSEAFVSLDGTLVVSPFFEEELKQFAPNVLHLSSPKNRGAEIPQCKNPALAMGHFELKKDEKENFQYDDCDPDSYPIPESVADSHSRYTIDTTSDKLTAKQIELFEALEIIKNNAKLEPHKKLSEIIRVDGIPVSLKASIDFREDPRKVFYMKKMGIKGNFKNKLARAILTELNKMKDLKLFVDPNSNADIEFYLGHKISGAKSSDEELAEVLFILLDHNDAKREYGFRNTESGPLNEKHLLNPPRNATYWNMLAEKPALHLDAKLNPFDLSEVMFRVSHVDTSSFKPMGQPNMYQMYTKHDTPHQHEGESEPTMMRLRVGKKGVEEVREIYFGAHHHFIVKTPEEYLKHLKKIQMPEAVKSQWEAYLKQVAEKKTVFPLWFARCYLSGGSIPIGMEEDVFAGTTMFVGSKAPMTVSLSTAAGVVPFYEVVPGLFNSENSVLITPDYRKNDVLLKKFEGENRLVPYDVVIEGVSGFNLFQSLMQNGSDGDALSNKQGYKGQRASVFKTDIHDRLTANVFHAARDQRGVAANNLQGKVAQLGAGMQFTPLAENTDEIEKYFIEFRPLEEFIFNLGSSSQDYPFGISGHFFLGPMKLYANRANEFGLNYSYLKLGVIWGYPDLIFTLTPLDLSVNILSNRANALIGKDASGDWKSYGGAASSMYTGVGISSFFIDRWNVDFGVGIDWLRLADKDYDNFLKLDIRLLYTF